MPISVRRELYVPAPDKATSENRWQRYTHGTGLRRVEHRSLQRESDWSNADYERHSNDNGTSWGEWKDVHAQGYETRGDDEINVYHGNEVYNPRHGHFVSVGMRRVFFGGHKAAYERFWQRGESGFVDHTLMEVRKDGSEDRSVELIKYEDGADYDPGTRRDPAYTERNRAYFGTDVDVLENGEIVFPIAAAVTSCCRILGLNVAEVFPSCPDIMHGLIVVRGSFNASRGNYDLGFSRPVVIGDLKSSRGVDEPACAVLPSGRIVAVFRGSNAHSPSWRTRIEPGTPGHKWFCYSDDGGKTFTESVPWHFDDREVFYSSATIHRFLRSERNGKIYWIGNVTDRSADGNYPRHPLVIAEVNERGLLAKSSLTVIDRREPGDSDKLQLSNFYLLQDRETGIVQLYLSKLGQREGNTWWSDCWRYFIDLGRREAEREMIRNLRIVTVSEATPELPRSSEGSLVELRNGDLFMVFQRYEKSEKGSEDDAPNKLVSMRSRDKGRSWGELRVEIVPEPGDVNVYSPNLIRLKDGRILFVYKRYVSLGGGRPTLTTAHSCVSTDECLTFGPRRLLWRSEPTAFASAGIRQLSDGRLVLPVEMSRKGTWGSRDENEVVGCAVSDDFGESFRVCPGWIELPMRGAMEGHVEELRDGRLIVVMRNQLGSVFKAFSSDRGESWSKPQTTGMRAPESCPEIMRVPGTGKLMLVWNPSEYDPGFRSHYGKRSPLSIGLSEDEGETFRYVCDIESDPEWAYSNPGATFLRDGTCVLNYWAVKYTSDWVMSGLIHLKLAAFDIV